MKRVHSPSHADVRKPLYRTAVGRWKNYEKYLEPYMPGLERFLKEFNYADATAIATIMLAISFALLLAINLLQAWTRRRLGNG